jgi:hypothetical protein
MKLVPAGAVLVFSFSARSIAYSRRDGTFTASPVFPLFGQNVNNAVVADFSGFLPGRLNP